MKFMSLCLLRSRALGFAMRIGIAGRLGIGLAGAQFVYA
jgi:hypothetical protein